MWERCNSTANVLELHLSCTNPSTYALPGFNVFIDQGIFFQHDFEIWDAYRLRVIIIFLPCLSNAIGVKSVLWVLMAWCTSTTRASAALILINMQLHLSLIYQIIYQMISNPVRCSGKAQVILCRSGGPNLYDLKNRGHRHGWLMKLWQHRTDILEVCSVGKRSAVIGKPVRQSFIVKLCRIGRDCGYDLFMDRFQSCVELETSWDCRTQHEGIRGQRVGIRGQRTDGREDRTNITIASCLIGLTFTF